MIYSSVVEAQAACEAWQKVMYVADWEVRVKIVPKADLADGKMGDITYDRSKKQAILRMIDPADHEANENFPLDHQGIIIHELNHLVWSWLDRFGPFGGKKFKEDLWDESMELAIDQSARALIRAGEIFSQNVVAKSSDTGAGVIN